MNKVVSVRIPRGWVERPESKMPRYPSIVSTPMMGMAQGHLVAIKPLHPSYNHDAASGGELNPKRLNSNIGAAFEAKNA
jgi:hypothetical protein